MSALADLKQLAVRSFRGTSHAAEYLGVADEPGMFRPFATLGLDGRPRAIDVTWTWLLVGIRPVSIAIVVRNGSEEARWLNDEDDALLTLTAEPFELNASDGGFASSRPWLARLKLRAEQRAVCGDKLVTIFVGTHGRHHLIDAADRTRLAVHDAWRRSRENKPGRVDPIAPQGNGYDQLRIGYSTARPVLAGIVAGESGTNVVPIDLQGPLGPQHHIVSLREGARVSEQVAASGQLVVFAMHARACADVYSLGRNHMATLSRRLDLATADARTPQLHLPIPTDAVGWRELSLRDIVTVGKHRLHLMDVVSETKTPPQTPIVAHLHLWYAMWLDRNGRSPRYLQRS